MAQSEQERARAKRLFEQLTRHNPSPSTLLLYRKVCDFISTVVQDDLCLLHTSHENRFRDILCDFSLAYIPVPVHDQMMTHAHLVNGAKQVGEGSNGRIYQSGSFQGNPIVTKTKKKWTSHSIYEIYINFVVLNTMLLTSNYEFNLIPTYGLFLCPTNSDGTQICVPSHKEESLFLVQKYVQGKTLASSLKDMSLPRFQSVVRELWSVLMALESSPHKLYHTDLHCSNVMMVDDHPVLLDFELCSFEVDGYRYRLNSLEHMYCKNEHIKSGAHDLVLLFSNALDHTTGEVKTYLMSVLERVCATFWVAPNTPLVVSSAFFAKNKERRWLFQILHDAERVLSGEDKLRVHEHNMTQLLYWTTYQALAKTYGLV